MLVGVHVRHGDRHPYDFQYRDSYIPIDRYSDKAHELMHQRFNNSGPSGGQNINAEEHSFIVLASDDPEVYDSEEFAHVPRAQEQIRLAAKQQLEAPKPAAMTGMRNFVDESVGWEGGFFAGMFCSRDTGYETAPYSRGASSERTGRPSVPHGPGCPRAGNGQGGLHGQCYGLQVVGGDDGMGEGD